MKNLSITTGSFLSLIGKSRPKNGFSITQHLDLKANAIFGVCKGTQIVRTLCAPQSFDLKAKRNFELCWISSPEKQGQLQGGHIWPTLCMPQSIDLMANLIFEFCKLLTSEQRGAL